MRSPNLRQAMLDSGWLALDARTHPRAYVDAGGQRYGTLEKGGVRIALSLNRCLDIEHGSAIVYQSDQTHQEAILQALIVDLEHRGCGKATAALQDLVALADICQTTLYLEPVPIDDKPAPIESLAALYRRHGFSELHGHNSVMVRHCSQPTQPQGQKHDCNN